MFIPARLAPLAPPSAILLATACLFGCSATDGASPVGAGGTKAIGTGGSVAFSAGGAGFGAGGRPSVAAGGAAVFTVADAGGALQARLQVNGNDNVCGSCDVLLVRARGGTGPYTYAWSDPALAGPGPHTLCPTEAAHYSVTVTDSSAVSTPEFHRPAQTAEATADLICHAPASDAGTPPTNGLNGCMVLTNEDPVTCGDAGVMETTVSSSHIPFDVEAGHPYQYSYDQLLPVGIGVASTVDVYLAMNPCERTEKAFTIVLDSLWTQSFCFTPTRAYRYSTSVIHVNGIPLTFGVTPTLCDTCAAGTLGP